MALIWRQEVHDEPSGKTYRVTKVAANKYRVDVQVFRKKRGRSRHWRRLNPETHTTMCMTQIKNARDTRRMRGLPV